MVADGYSGMVGEWIQVLAVDDFLMESLVLRGLSWKSVIAFLDDVVVVGRDFDNHMVNLSDVLRRF